MRGERRGMAGTLRTRAIAGCHAAAVRTIRAILAVIGPHTYTVVQWNRRRTDRTVVLLG